MFTSVSPTTKQELTLFAIAWEYAGKCGVNYAHAPNANVARHCFQNSRPYGYHIVAVAPAVGAFAQDNHGDVCLL
jgi:hypothetical protein